MKVARAFVLLFLCLLAACTSPWGGDVACLSVASYAERVECQSKVQRSISSDEELRRQALRSSNPSNPVSANDKGNNMPDPLCYVKAGEGEKPCTK